MNLPSQIAHDALTMFSGLAHVLVVAVAILILSYAQRAYFFVKREKRRSR